jgi:radical SAM protein with 4Fe4S-binding SPASM domain
MMKVINEPFVPTHDNLVLHDLRIELLKACPLLCVHCSAYAAPYHALQLSYDRVTRLIDEFVALDGRRVTFTGGEPFVYPRIADILAQCYKHGIQTRLFSSGIIIQKGERTTIGNMLKNLSSSIDTIMFSVYSSRPTVHDQITCITGSYALTMQAIQQTVAHGIQAEIHFVPTRVNYQDLPLVVELAAKLSVQKVGILRFVPQGRGKAKSDALILTAQEHQWLRTVLSELRTNYPTVNISTGSAYNVLHMGEPVACSAGVSQLVVEANGRILPCSAFSGVPFKDEVGNILQHSLQEVWRRSTYLQKVRQELNAHGNCHGCLAQKTLYAGQITGQIADPLEECL